MGIKNLEFTLTIYNFKLNINKPYLSGPYIFIPYIGIASPTLANNVSLDTYQYSIDGINWENLTPTEDTIITGLTFTPQGNEYIFKWSPTNRKTLFNKDIFIKMRAHVGPMYTAITTITVYFQKIINTETKNISMELPLDYRGIDGTDLLKRAPKTNIIE